MFIICNVHEPLWLDDFYQEVACFLCVHSLCDNIIYYWHLFLELIGKNDEWPKV